MKTKEGNNLLFNEEYVVVDLETTGLSPFNGDEIIEIGVTEIKNNNICLNFSRLIKPKGIIPSSATMVNNITNEMVQNEKTLEEVLPKFREYVGDRTVVAHNAKFDVTFLNYYLEKQGLPLITNYICTMEMLKKLKSYTSRSKSLKSACEFYGITNSNAHRADADTYATAQIFLKIKDAK